MKGYLETHTLGWLKRVLIDSVEDISLEGKSQIVCQALAGIPLPLVIVRETGNRMFEAITQSTFINAINEYLEGKFKLVENYALINFLDNSFLNKSFSDLEDELQDTLLTDQQVAIFIAVDSSQKEQMYTQCMELALTTFVNQTKPSGLSINNKNAVIDRGNKTANIIFSDNPAERVLLGYLNHPFFNKVSIRALDTDIILQMLMVSPNGVDKDLSTKNMLEFKVNLPLEKNKQLDELSKVLDFLDKSFNDKNKNLKKAHLPMVYLCAKEAVNSKMSPKEFSAIIESFFNAEIQEYKKAGNDGTATKSKVNTRIQIMLEYFRNHIK